MSDAIDPSIPPAPSSSDASEGQTIQEALPTRPVIAGKALLKDLCLTLAWIACTDFLLYQIGTFLAWGVFLLGAILFFAFAKRSMGNRLASLGVAILLFATAAKLMWCGGGLTIACGIFLLLCYCMALTGSPPFLPEILGFMGYVLAGAAQRFSRFRFGTLNAATGKVRPLLGVALVLPALIVLAFGVLFVLANPDLASTVTLNLQWIGNSLTQFLLDIDAGQAVFWVVSGWLMLGLLYPAAIKLFSEPSSIPVDSPTRKAELYPALRNTFLSVNVLFAIYLLYEFSTLWFRSFPADFYYAGYAHQGAFWLTVALALATLILSTTFRGDTLLDPRLPTLRRLAGVWSFQNLLLSMAVYNRMFIYIDFNGMTRLRIVGLLGITCVLLGFALVVIQFVKSKGFVWLIHRQLWVPTLAVVGYAILPVDWMVNEYNARCVARQELAPSVQIIAQPTTAEGMLPVLSLADHENETIRDGVRAMMAIWAQALAVESESSLLDLVAPNEIEPEAQERIAQSATTLSTRSNQIIPSAWRSHLGHSSPWIGQREFLALRPQREDWLDFQAAEFLLSEQLRSQQAKWKPFAESPHRQIEALNAFFEYTYQWY